MTATRSDRQAAATTPAATPSRAVDLLTAAALRARGWTDAAIRRFLGGPDQTAPNPYYRSAAPLRLYDAARVAAVETSDQWQTWQTRSATRRAAARAAAERRRQQTIAEVAALPIRIVVLARQELEARAVAHRNTRSAERAARHDWDDADEPATVDGVDPKTLERWCVNWLRHQGTVYDQALAKLYARVGRREAARLLRARVYGKIARAYPWLEAETQRQQALRETGGTE